MIIVQRLDENLRVRIDELAKKYSHACIEGHEIDVYINRIFNEEKKVVSKPERSISLKIVKDIIYKFLDFSIIAPELGIPTGYFVEVLATNFVTARIPDMSPLRVPIFPNEIKIDADSQIKELIEDEIKTLEKVGKTLETVGLLSDHNLPELADHLRDGITRLEKFDYEGSVMSFRKVIEGFRNLMKDKIVDGSENRSKEIRSFLSKAFSLLSNFGEHVGTRGLMDEAIFARELAVSVSGYMLKKI